MRRRRSTWARGECTICLLHQRHFIWPMPRWVFWHQRGLPPLNLEYPDPANVYEDERERWADVFDWDESRDLEPVEMRHYNRQHRQAKKRGAR